MIVFDRPTYNVNKAVRNSPFISKKGSNRYMYNENEFLTQRINLGDELLQKSPFREQSAPFLAPRINCKGEEVMPKSQERETWGLEGYPLASVYSPIQNFRNLYEPSEALMRGTLFIELDLPFEGNSVAMGGGCCGK